MSPQKLLSNMSEKGLEAIRNDHREYMDHRTLGTSHRSSSSSSIFIHLHLHLHISSPSALQLFTEALRPGSLQYLHPSVDCCLRQIALSRCPTRFPPQPSVPSNPQTRVPAPANPDDTLVTTSPSREQTTNIIIATRREIGVTEFNLAHTTFND